VGRPALAAGSDACRPRAAAPCRAPGTSGRRHWTALPEAGACSIMILLNAVRPATSPCGLLPARDNGACAPGKSFAYRVNHLPVPVAVGLRWLERTGQGWRDGRRPPIAPGVAGHPGRRPAAPVRRRAAPRPPGQGPDPGPGREARWVLGRDDLPVRDRAQAAGRHRHAAPPGRGARNRSRGLRPDAGNGRISRRCPRGRCAGRGAGRYSGHWPTTGR
jgi:hypothetical protein